MKKNTWTKGWSINDTSDLLKNKYYNKHYQKKMKLQSKYDSRLFDFESRPPKSTKDWYKEKGYKQWRKYLVEVADLIFAPNSGFQEFTWDIMSKVEQEKRTRTARGRISGNGEYR